MREYHVRFCEGLGVKFPMRRHQIWVIKMRSLRPRLTSSLNWSACAPPTIGRYTSEGGRLISCQRCARLFDDFCRKLLWIKRCDARGSPIHQRWSGKKRLRLLHANAKGERRNGPAYVECNHCRD
jgi:hypothetical protein